MRRNSGKPRSIGSPGEPARRQPARLEHSGSAASYQISGGHPGAAHLQTAARIFLRVRLGTLDVGRYNTCRAAGTRSNPVARRCLSLQNTRKSKFTSSGYDAHVQSVRRYAGSGCAVRESSGRKELVMPVWARFLALLVMSTSVISQLGCHLVPQSRYRQSLLRSQQLHGQSQALAMERDQARDSIASLAAEKERLAQQNSTLQNNLQLANQRLDNLAAERSKYVSLLNQKSPLSDATTQRLQDLQSRYPDFQFDPQTGVSKFHSDILFGLGSDDLRNEAVPLLREFASILNDGDAQRLNILVVGHTDDRPIAKASTRAKHPTNWHLSTDRANSVVLALSKYGVAEKRMGATGYSMHQPVAPNTNDKARAMNRRVEIFVLAPDAVIAGWDPGTAIE